MNNSVILKGNRYGISIVLNDKTEFSQILLDLGERLEKAGEFFDCSKQLVVSFEGRVLSNTEIDQLLTVINEKSHLNIQYVLEENSDLEATFYDIIHSEDDKIAEESVQIDTTKDDMQKSCMAKEESSNHLQESEKYTMFYRGTLRSGQALEAKESIVIVGDVNPGASVKAGKNIVVIGSLKGNVYAGTNGDKDSFVMALVMNPVQMQINGVVSKVQDNRLFGKSNKEAMIARVEENHVVMDSVSKYAIYDMKY